MGQYIASLKNKALQLRSEGKTYKEITIALNRAIPKSTYTNWFKDVVMPPSYSYRMKKENIDNLSRARVLAIGANKVKRVEFSKNLTELNMPISKQIHEFGAAKIALAMLCLGEARKYNKGGSFYLGSSDPRIIIIFINLLKNCFNFDLEKVRCTVQCRADQNTKELEKYWQDITGIPKRLFYKSNIDPRTIGKPTKKIGYKGVLRVNYFDSSVQQDLESLSALIYNRLNSKGL